MSQVEELRGAVALLRDAVIGNLPAKGSDDIRARTAVADGAWQRDRALMYGIAALVELLAGGEPC